RPGQSGPAPRCPLTGPGVHPRSGFDTLSLRGSPPCVDSCRRSQGSLRPNDPPPSSGGVAMSAIIRLLPLPFAAALAALPPSPAARATPRQETYWEVDEVRAGQKGHGLTVLKGTRIEKFDAEVLGVLKNTSPGRDLVLCRLSGLNLEKTGVIAGMSGSPVYIDGKLLGAVAYAWAFGQEPI